MEHQSFFPRSTRNRIALVLGALSLMFFVTWNLMPNIESMLVKSEHRHGYFFVDYWTQAFSSLKNIPHLLSIESAPYFLYTFMLFLHLFIMFSIIPAWKIWQTSAIIRNIPATLFIITVLFLCYRLQHINISSTQLFITCSLITSNFLTTALSLLSFKNEWIEPETSH